jgi:hypothetical protein
VFEFVSIVGFVVIFQRGDCCCSCYNNNNNNNNNNLLLLLKDEKTDVLVAFKDISQHVASTRTS